MANKTARVLARTAIEGVFYEPNQLVTLDDKTLKLYSSDLDATAEAVSYCIDELGEKPIAHKRAG
jgi:hypothetical protein